MYFFKNRISKATLAFILALISIMTCSISTFAALPAESDVVSPTTMIVTENFYKDYICEGKVSGYTTVRVSVDITYDAQNDRIISTANAKAYENGVSWLGEWDTVSVSVTKDQYYNVYVHVVGDVTVTYFDAYGVEVTQVKRHEFTATFTV